VRREVAGVTIAGQVIMRTSHSLLRNSRHRATIMVARMKANGNFQWRKPRTVAFSQYKVRDEPEWRRWHGVAP